MYVKARRDAVTVKLNRAFYPEEIVRRCVKDARTMYKVEQTNTSDYFVITIKPHKKVEMQALGYEFCNYVLSAMKAL
jgi:hypothetical protein